MKYVKFCVCAVCVSLWIQRRYSKLYSGMIVVVVRVVVVVNGTVDAARMMMMMMMMAVISRAPWGTKDRWPLRKTR